MGKGRRGKDNADRPLIFADSENTVYGQIVSPLGQGQFKVNCSDSISRIAKVRGKDYKRIWIQPNDFVLLSLREGNVNRADIELKYVAKEVKILKENGYIEDNFNCEKQTNFKIDFD